MAKQKKVNVLTDDQLNKSAVNFVEFAASRGWGLEEVIIYPLTSRPVYLLEKYPLNQLLLNNCYNYLTRNRMWLKRQICYLM